MMNVLWIALKDIKLLLRDKMAAFFVLGFPILMGVFFGLMMGGVSSGSSSKMKLAIVDQDQSAISTKFIDSLKANENLQIETDTWEPARESVRRGERIGMLVLPEEFGKTAGIMWAEQPAIQLGLDPSRTAESAMIQGFVMESMGKLIADRFMNPMELEPLIEEALQSVTADDDLSQPQRTLLETMFGSMKGFFKTLDDVQQQNRDEASAAGDAEVQESQFQFAKFENIDVTRELDPGSVQAQVAKLRSRWDISFPQAMMWGVMGCVAGFAVSIARERARGTLLRLRIAPLTQLQLLAGKALACFIATMIVIGILVVLGVQLGMRPESYSRLFVAAVMVSFCFVGIVMLMSTLGKTEEAVGGIGWAINMVMAMIGGAMVPVMFMPAMIQRLSILSPVHWSIRALEGAIWRGFSWTELAQPLIILGAVGTTGLVLGAWMITRQNRMG